MPERRVSEIVTKADRLGQILVQAQRPGDTAGDAGGLERVREPGTVMVAARVDEDLRLVLEPAEGLRVHDPVSIPLKRRSQPTVVLRVRPPACLVRTHREG